jgi:hypothetical protein
LAKSAADTAIFLHRVCYCSLVRDRGRCISPSHMVRDRGRCISPSHMLRPGCFHWAHRIMSSGELTHSLPLATHVSGTRSRSVPTPLAYLAAVWYMPAILHRVAGTKRQGLSSRVSIRRDGLLLPPMSAARASWDQCASYPAACSRGEQSTDLTKYRHAGAMCQARHHLLANM